MSKPNHRQIQRNAENFDKIHVLNASLQKLQNNVLSETEHRRTENKLYCQEILTNVDQCFVCLRILRHLNLSKYMSQTITSALIQNEAIPAWSF